MTIEIYYLILAISLLSGTSYLNWKLDKNISKRNKLFIDKISYIHDTEISWLRDITLNLRTEVEILKEQIKMLNDQNTST